MAAWGISMYSIVLPVLLGIIPGITPGSVLADETSSWGCGILSGLFADEEREYIRSSRRLADIQSRREIDERKCDAAGKTPAETPYERSCTQLGGVPNQEPPPPDPHAKGSRLRQAIVRNAASQLGVFDSTHQGVDCKKKGARALRAYYDIAGYTQWQFDLKHPGRRYLVPGLTARQKRYIDDPKVRNDDNVKVGDWCAIFALASAKSAAEQLVPPSRRALPNCGADAADTETRGACALVHSHFQQADGGGIMGITQLQWSGQGALPIRDGSIKPGDIVSFNTGSNHHAVVESVDLEHGMIYTIDGNMPPCQGIIRSKRPLTQVLFSYPAQ